MVANGVNVNQSAARAATSANPTIPVYGFPEYGSQPVNPWVYASQAYDPRYAAFSRFDPRLGISPVDPRFGPATPIFDPRFGPSMPMFDPRFGSTGPTSGPGWVSTLSPYDPRFELPVLGWGLDQSAPGYDAQFLNWWAMQAPGLGVDGQPLMTGEGFWDLPGRVSQVPFVPALSPAGLGEVNRLGPIASRWGIMGLPKDEEIEEAIHEALDRHPFIPLDADIDVRCESGQVTLTGKVTDKRIKRAAGETAWWLPGVTDVSNNIVVSGRRQAQATRRRGRQQSVQAGR
jgi:BON domain